MRKLKSWQKSLLAGAGLIVPILSCSQRSLVLIDVHAPQGVAYTDVTVIIKADKQTTTFDKVTFDAAGVFKAGVYIPSDMTGTVTLHGDVDQNNCVLGSGDASTDVMSQGETTMTVDLPIAVSSLPCTAGTGGSAGASATGGAGGAGGMVGAGGSVGGGGGLTGTAGGGGSIGTGGVGAGGVSGNAGAPGLGGKGGVTGAGGVIGTGGHGSGGVTGAGGTPTTGTGGSPTTGAGGSPTTGAGGSPTTGTGGVTGAGGKGGGGAPGTGGVTGAGGIIGSGGVSGCNCPTNFVCMPGTTVCVCSQTDAEACAGVACGTTTNLCQQSVSCPDTCPVGYSCVGNFCKQLTSTGCGGDIVATGTGLVSGSSAAPPVCP